MNYIRLYMGPNGRDCVTVTAYNGYEWDEIKKIAKKEFEKHYKEYEDNKEELHYLEDFLIYKEFEDEKSIYVGCGEEKTVHYMEDRGELAELKAKNLNPRTQEYVDYVLKLFYDRTIYIETRV